MRPGSEQGMSEQTELPYVIDRQVAIAEDALRNIATRGDARDRAEADRLSELVRELAASVAGKQADG